MLDGPNLELAKRKDRFKGAPNAEALERHYLRQDSVTSGSCVEHGYRLGDVTGKKKGPQLGIWGPEGRVSLSVSFSHRRVGSSILASLSEAGGTIYREMTSKPLPPRFVTLLQTAI